MKRPPVSDAEWQIWCPGTPRELRGRALCDVGGRACRGRLSGAAARSRSRALAHAGGEDTRSRAKRCSGSGAETFELRAGSYVCFPAGQAAPHCLYNTGRLPFAYLMIGERIPGDEVRSA
jgi:hypothetical protein